ncbi:hypothetical protein GUJ93_ZPchr0130g6527 [Zizania palustris]|uniref:Uncharacterized protein n=1 Tax=Zizania palustris TaxID=103762 RepID=A0A8J5VGD3_ZIZPA|nr:hypothetical protein GUJ93_ZPchr0130g6527 [Zizania palustris]
MDPKIFVRLSVGQLGLKLPGANANARKPCHCEIRLRGFPIQIAPVRLINCSELNLDPHSSNAAVFSLDESDLKALSKPGCLGGHGSYIEVAVYLGRRGRHCGIVTGMKRLVGVVRVELGPEWRDGKPVLLHHGWAGIGNSGEARPELHLRVTMEADPRYIFEFDDEVALNPQVVQLHGRIRQPIFSCKFIRDRRSSQADQLGGAYWSSSGEEEKDVEMMRRRERKGWKVVIHDLSGSAVATAFMTTPFVPAKDCDTVARSNPGAWLIARAGATVAGSSSEIWQPWGRLEAWREGPGAAGKDTVCLRLRLLPEGQDACMLVAETPLRSDKGGEFFIDMDRQAPAPAAGGGLGEACGFVMSCRVEGESRSSRPLVQLATRHVTCMEDAAMFVALAAAVDLSVKACRPFRRKTAVAKKAAPDPLELDT